MSGRLFDSKIFHRDISSIHSDNPASEHIDYMNLHHFDLDNRRRDRIVAVDRCNLSRDDRWRHPFDTSIDFPNKTMHSFDLRDRSHHGNQTKLKPEWSCSDKQCIHWITRWRQWHEEESTVIEHPPMNHSRESLQVNARIHSDRIEIAHRWILLRPRRSSKSLSSLRRQVVRERPTPVWPAGEVA